MKTLGLALISSFSALLFAVSAHAYSPCVAHLDDVFSCVTDLPTVHLEMQFERGSIVNRSTDPKRQCTNLRSYTQGKIIAYSHDMVAHGYAEFEFTTDSKNVVKSIEGSFGTGNFVVPPTIVVTGNSAQVNFQPVSTQEAPAVAILQTVRCVRAQGRLND